jgi:serine/threonine-protein kinase SRPK3
MARPSVDKTADDEFDSYGYPPIPFDVEDIDRYRPGGFHPVIAGDVIGDRFEVIHKLGHGGFGTVWLCYDSLEDKWRAVKVVAASHSDKDSPELSVLKHFEDVTDDELEQNHICLPRHHFFVDGPNGRHLCIVMPVLGRSLHDFYLDNGDDVDVTHEISYQMAQALGFLHSRGVCHGDFRPRNMLFKVNERVHELSFDEIMSMIPQTGRLQVPPLPSTGKGPGPHLPQYIYPCSALQPPSDLMTKTVVVTDFGEAYHISEPPNSTGIPLSFAPPEVILPSEPLGPGADMWAFGNTLCEMRLGNALLPDLDTFYYFKAVEDMLGPLPEPYRSVWIERGYGTRIPGLPPASEIPATHPVTMKPETAASNRQMRLDDDGWKSYLEQAVREVNSFGLLIKPGDVLGPNERVDAMGLKWVVRTVPEQEADQLLDLLTKIFKYDPAERASTSEVLAHPWIDLGRRVHLATPAAEEDHEEDVIGVEVENHKGPDEKTAVEEPVQMAEAEANAPPAVAPEAPKSPEDVFEEVMFDAATVLEEDHVPVPAAQQNGLFAWFARVARAMVPRMYDGPMLFGGLCLHA